MGTLDVGGGLGIDYDGTRSGESDMSVAYGFEEYASTVVQAARLVCNQKGVVHPVLCSESGRALVSHQSILIYDALSAVQEPSDSVSSDELISRLDDLVGNPTNVHANLKSALSRRLAKQLEAAEETTYAYHANLSVFSLTPDFWGIKQLFPILPIHRLDEEPKQKGTLIDLTCDSDGKVDQFIGGTQSLPLHCVKEAAAGTTSGRSWRERTRRRWGAGTICSVGDFGTGGEIGRELRGLYGGSRGDGPSAADQLKAMHHDPAQMKVDIAKRGADVGQWTEEEEQLVSKVFGDMPYLFGAA
uniref:Arginine decarboxylase n=1 Tax=Ananas comosus var. bracteatus TaxID=296719 RepID=A0A6V7QP67_ANACO|nr:unnamed protein product [Ananas comosus var. bracteatus]